MTNTVIAIVLSKFAKADAQVKKRKKYIKDFPLHLNIFFTILASANKGTKSKVHMYWNICIEATPYRIKNV